MIKLKIIEKDEYSNYVLEDKNCKKYEVNINFIGIEEPKIGTIIYINKSILDENVSLNFGLIDSKKLANENELIIIVSGEDKKYLKRYYGQNYFYVG